MSETNPSNVPNETWLQFVREASATKREIEEASGRHRSVMKRAKAAGCNPKIIALAIASKRQDPAIVSNEIRDTVRVLNLVGVTMTQTDLFAGWSPEVTEKAAMEHDHFTADERGYDAGKAGQDRDGNPFEPGSPFHVAWDAGWLKGQAAIAAAMAPGATQASARRARPKREEVGADAPAAVTRTGRRRGRPPASAAH